jgi:lysophospholipase L1-like esterase
MKSYLRVPLLIVLVLSNWQLVLFGQEEKNAAIQPEDRKDKWWQDRHEQKLAQLKETEKVDLLMIGDSITHGWENGGSATWAKFYKDRNAFNIGFSGDRTEHVLWRLDNGEVDGISPKLIVMMIGTNNTGHRQDKPENTAEGIKAILAKLQQKLPESKVLLLGVFPRGATADDPLRKINTGINDIIKGYADDKRVFFLDISDKFLAEEGELPKSVMPDLLHPNAKGYQIWAEAMEPKIVELMGEQ